MSAAAHQWTLWLRSVNESADPARKPDYGMIRVHVEFGCPMHSKSKEDGHFVLIRPRVDSAAKGRPITLFEHILEVLRAGAETVSCQPGRSLEIYVDWLPSAAKEPSSPRPWFLGPLPGGTLSPQTLVISGSL